MQAPSSIKPVSTENIQVLDKSSEIKPLLPAPSIPDPLNFSKPKEFYVKCEQSGICFTDLVFTVYYGTYENHNVLTPLLSVNVPYPSFKDLTSSSNDMSTITPAPSQRTNDVKYTSLVPAFNIKAGLLTWKTYSEQNLLGTYSVEFDSINLGKVIKNSENIIIYNDQKCCLYWLCLQCFRNCCRLPLIQPRVLLRSYVTKDNEEEALSIYRVCYLIITFIDFYLPRMLGWKMLGPGYAF